MLFFLNFVVVLLFLQALKALDVALVSIHAGLEGFLDFKITFKT